MYSSRGTAFAWATMALLAIVVPRAGFGQTVSASATAVQSLSFGSMLPGTSEVVSVQDGWRRGEMQIGGSGQVSVRFVLPTALTNSAGQSIPVVFGGSDGAYVTAKTSSPTYFDPNVGTKVNLTAGRGSATVYLGGTAKPAALQAAGSYSATVMIVLSPPNM